MSSPTPPQLPEPVAGLLRAVKVDFVPARVQPSVAEVALATVVAIVGSLVADAVLVAIGKAVFPSTVGYPHYQFGDYSKLTIIGVVVACVGWPILTKVSSAPRWVYLRLAVLVTIVLLLPDVWLYVVGNSPEAVTVLVVMHLVIAVVTYLAVVRIAPAGATGRREASSVAR